MYLIEDMLVKMTSIQILICFKVGFVCDTYEHIAAINAWSIFLIDFIIFFSYFFQTYSIFTCKKSSTTTL